MAETDYYRMTAGEALRELDATADGLSTEEAARRRETYGENELITGRGTSKVLMFLSQFKDLLVLVLIVAGLASYGIAAVQGRWDNFRDGSVMFVIVLLNAGIGFVQSTRRAALWSACAS
jgi:Ca2+-transporting ATPase